MASRCLGQCLPRYLLTTTFWLTDFLWLQTLLWMGNYTYFVKDPGQWEVFSGVLGGHDICPSLTQFQVAQVTWPELSVLSCAGAWGDTKKSWGNMAFLLIATKKTIKGERAFGLAMVWAHPYQAHLSSLDEVAKNLTLLISLGDN